MILVHYPFSPSRSCIRIIVFELTFVPGGKLRGKSAIVTGGSAGIGMGIVQYLTKAGATILNEDIQPSTEPVEGVLF